MAAPRVSAICIFYNAERFLAEAIESVLAQDFTDFELLLVDDGSTDGGTAIAHGYVASDPERIRYLEHPGHENRGMSATRNLGLSKARGEFVAFIDSDDAWRPGKLREQVALLDAHPGVGMVCGAVNYWRSWNGGEDRVVPTGHVADGISGPRETSLALYPLGSANAPPPSDILFRGTALDRIGGFEEHFTGPMQMYEDQACLSKLYLAAPVYFSTSVWLDYRLHADSFTSQTMRDRKYGSVRRAFLEWFSAFLASGEHSGEMEIRRAVDRALRNLDRPRLGSLRTFPKRIARRLIGPFAAGRADA